MRGGTELPTTARKLGELFSLTSGATAGIHRAVQVSPAVWVREPSNYSVSGPDVFEVVLGSGIVETDQAAALQIVPAISGRRMLVTKWIALYQSGDVVAFATLSPAFRLDWDTSPPSIESYWQSGIASVRDIMSGGVYTSGAAEPFPPLLKQTILQPGTGLRVLITDTAYGPPNPPVAVGIAGEIYCVVLGALLD